MRITNSMLVSNLMKNLNSNMKRLDKLQSQLSTGRKFAHISDDPISLVYSQAARNKTARLSHYQKSVETAQNWLDQAEIGVMDLQKTLADALESAVGAANDTMTNDDRRNISATMEQYRNHFVDTLNTTFGDKYVFAGYNTPGDPAGSVSTEGVKAFVVKEVIVGGNPELRLFYNGFDLSQLDNMSFDDYTQMINAPDFASVTNPPTGWTADDYNSFKTLLEDVLIFDVGLGVEMPVTMNGIELVLFRTTDGDGNHILRNSFNVLQDLYLAAENEGDLPGKSQEISDLIKPLQDAQSHLLTKTAEIGGRLRRLELLEARYEQDWINYENMRSNAEDVEMTEVIMNHKMAEAVYQAALSAGARIIQPTLMDFLR